MEFHAWEQRKLLDVKDTEDRYSYTGGPFGSDLKSSDYTETGVRIIQLQNIGDGKFLNDYKIYTSEEKAESLNSNLIYPGEIIIAKMADPLARATILPNIELKYLMASDGIRLKINTNCFDNYYILTLINSDVFRKEALNNSTGTTRKRIGLVTLGNLPMMIPSFEEQQKIGSFFKQLDDTIALHQCKIEALKQIKKGFLQQLFLKNQKHGENIPKLRFTDFKEEWELRKLNNSIKVLDGDRGSNYPHDSDFFESGDTLFLDTGNVTKNGFNFDSLKYITKEKDENLRAGKLEKNDFVLTSRGTLGNVGFYDEIVYKLHPKIRINSAMLILRKIDEQLSYNYLHTLLKGRLISDFMKKNQVGSAQPHITKTEFLKLDLNVPCNIEEQNKIGDFFKILDNTITLHQNKLDQLKKLKTAFLQNMFI